MTQLGIPRLGWENERLKRSGALPARMNVDDRRKECEEVLASYVSMCYCVALSLSKNEAHARKLTRDVLAWAWKSEESVILGPRFKMVLLRQLREVYLHGSLVHERRCVGLG
jgi:hypothetical protein